jgi:hypothetical protein
MTLKKSTAGRIKIATTILPTLDIEQLDSVDASQAGHSALMQPTNVLVAGAAPPGVRCKMPFAAAFGVFGMGLTSYATTDVVEAYIANIIGASVDSASTHTKYAKPSGFTACAWIDDFDVSEGGELLATVVMQFYSDDGINDPCPPTNNVAFPALSAIPENHGIGTLTINGTAYEGVVGASYRSGLAIEYQRVDGNPYPTGGAPSGFSPVLSVQTADPVTLRAAVGRRGIAIASSTTLQFRKYLNDVLSATGAKTITIASGYVRPSGAQGRHGGLYKGGIDILGASSNGSTHPFAVA